MSIFLVVALVALALLAVLAVAAWLMHRGTDERSRSLLKRVLRLPMRAKLRLAWLTFRDRRVPLLVRLLPPALIFYLAMPVDIIPDFIPVIGQLDDLLVVAIGAGLLLRMAPLEVIDAHVSDLEVRYGSAPETAEEQA
jgi:uncharacterized membrane protein YkvA (DUF1232 family)